MQPLADTGRVIARRYRLQAPIGRGAMGVVWRAHDQLLDREVAIKEVQIADTLTEAEQANAFQRTLREAKTAARLNHPAVVTVYDVAEDAGRPWIVMQLVHARSLDQVLSASGPLSARRAAEVGRQVLSALSVAHGAGVMHRDVKPSNVLLGSDDRAVLTDFGIATFQGDPRLTQTGMVMGSPGFTAPERIRGEDASPASDLWSLGATLFAAVEGHGPYERRGGAITTMSAIINEDAPGAQTAGALGPVIAALLRREPADRPDALTAARMITDVLPLLPDGAEKAPAQYEATALSSPMAGDPIGADAGTGLPLPAAQAAQEQTTPQSALGGTSRYPGEPPPDFSSWYSPAPGSGSASAGSGQPWQGPAYQPQPGPAPRSGAGRGYPSPRRRRGLWWKIALVVLALVGAGAGAATVLLLHKNHSGGSTTSSSPTLASPATAPQIVDAINMTPPSGLPAGWAAFTHRASAAAGEAAGFTIGAPGNWTPSTSGHQTFLRDPSAYAYILVDLTPHTYPRDMLAEARYIQSQTLARGNFPGYILQGLARHVIRGTPGAYWKFTWQHDGVRQEVIDLFFVAHTSAGPQSYALYMTAPASMFDQLRPTFDEAAETFAPQPS
jgi:serine/threonine protein kinase